MSTQSLNSSKDGGQDTNTELIKNRLIQKDHINRAHDIVNQCFKDQIDDSGQAYIQKFMQPHMHAIIHK
jgi:hypothetical protein